jgi:intracellular sulfur oxidation DsrE/DsrF family protein
MSPISTPPVPRRGFLVRLSQATAAVTALFADPARLDASAPISVASADPDAWLAKLTGREKVMIHVHQYFMSALVDSRNMLANGRDLYGVPEAQHSIAVITHGVAIQGLFRDDVWQKFALGDFYKVNDPKTGAPSTRNIYLTPPDNQPADAVVPDLMKRGVTFVVCNVALKNLSKKLARDGKTPGELRDELEAGLIPGAFLVPDVFVSMSRAQKRGVAYIYTDRAV